MEHTTFERMLSDLERAVVEIGARMDAQLADLRALRADMAALRADTVSGFAGLRADVREFFRHSRTVIDRQCARIDAAGERVAALEAADDE